ncbi:serine/threonine-protein kinase [Rhodopirellula sp. JC639]|uniref:serine/threonine-protein kinase n=1 Tax=Stieleria mannarensis TaxID=2755585 RepID=UPI002570CA9E|nr:serine/threonine-protein kinase [Rhodopirellula sp. JC639]
MHYNRETLNDFLHDRLDSDTEDITAHIEACEECQSAIEQMVETNWSWRDAGELLRTPVADFTLESASQRAANEQNARSGATNYLAPSEHPDSIGRFARYEIQRVLGRGGMGIVMLALDTSLGRLCAVKVLAPELATSAAARKRFSREAKSAAAVVHPHVVPIQTVDEHDGLPYLVMPVVEGPSLQQRVAQEGPLSLIETVRIAAQIADGLSAAHEQGLVHRDIKPANILLENGVERVQITDFGLARAVDDASVTRSGVIAGTPQYMSPEQAHGDSIDHRSDLFSLGSVMYFMLTGRSPFRAETTMGVLNRIGNDTPRSLRDIHADVPEWLESIVMRLLSKHPDQRYRCSSEVAQALKGWQSYLLAPGRAEALQDAPPIQLPESVPAGGRKTGGTLPWILAAGLIAGLLWAATIIIFQTDQGTLQIESFADTDVPIVVRQGDEVVKQLTVTREGASIEVKSGAYVIEITGVADGFEIKNDSVVIKRGATQVAKIVETKSAAGDTTPDTVAQVPQRSEFQRSESQRTEPQRTEPPKLSPFTRMEFNENQVLVTYHSQRYQLLQIDHFAIDDLVQKAQAHFGKIWKKRLSEDLVQVFWSQGHFPGESVRLKLKRPKSGKVVSVVAKMTEANRQTLYRENGHNQPVNRHVEDFLQEVLSSKTSVQANDVPLEKFLSEIAEKHRVPILLDRRNLMQAGVPNDASVTIDLQNVSLRSVLKMALAKVGCRYEVKHEIIRVFAATKP